MIRGCPGAGATAAARASTPEPARRRPVPAALSRSPPRRRGRPQPRAGRLGGETAPPPAPRPPPRSAALAPRSAHAQARAGDRRGGPCGRPGGRGGDAGPAGPRRAPGRRLVEIADALPAGVLWALGILAALALWLAGSAFWQTRKRAALERQRATLLDDIGLLSAALLPPVFENLDGLTVSAAYRPADGPGAGGDFYDVFALEDGRVGVLLGDVSGHGRASLRHAALARFTLRTLLADGHPVGEALAHADPCRAHLRPTSCRDRAVYASMRLTDVRQGGHPRRSCRHPYDPGTRRRPPIGLGFGGLAGVHVTWRRDPVPFTDGLEDRRVDGCGSGATGSIAARRPRRAVAERFGGHRRRADSVATHRGDRAARPPGPQAADDRGDVAASSRRSEYASPSADSLRQYSPPRAGTRSRSRAELHRRGEPDVGDQVVAADYLPPSSKNAL